MAKLTLVTRSTSEYLYLTSAWFRALIEPYFDIEPYRPEHTYHAHQHCVLASYVDVLEKQTWYEPLLASGCRLLVEHLGDSDVDRITSGTDQQLVLRNPNWMWYNACLEWSWYQLDQYTPNRHYSYNFLMLMNLKRWHRDRIVRDLHTVLPEALYSYASQGRELPGTPPANIPWRGWLNPAWYDSTPYTVVVESYMRSRGWSADPASTNYKTEVSEKIFKPMLGQHPFLVYGSVDTLKYLRREGFATYDNLWDETYDTVVEDTPRFEQVTQQVLSAVERYNYRTFQLTPDTVERIRHNYARLFDRTLVQQRFTAEVVGDIMTWWNP